MNSNKKSRTNKLIILLLVIGIAPQIESMNQVLSKPYQQRVNQRSLAAKPNMSTFIPLSVPLTMSLSDSISKIIDCLAKGDLTGMLPLIEQCLTLLEYQISYQDFNVFLNRMYQTFQEKNPGLQNLPANFCRYTALQNNPLVFITLLNLGMSYSEEGDSGASLLAFLRTLKNREVETAFLIFKENKFKEQLLTELESKTPNQEEIENLVHDYKNFVSKDKIFVILNQLNLVKAYNPQEELIEDYQEFSLTTEHSNPLHYILDWPISTENTMRQELFNFFLLEGCSYEAPNSAGKTVLQLIANEPDLQFIYDEMIDGYTESAPALNDTPLKKKEKKLGRKITAKTALLSNLNERFSSSEGFENPDTLAQQKSREELELQETRKEIESVKSKRKLKIETNAVEKQQQQLDGEKRILEEERKALQEKEKAETEALEAEKRRLEELRQKQKEEAEKLAEQKRLLEEKDAKRQKKEEELLRRQEELKKQQEEQERLEELAKSLLRQKEEEKEAQKKERELKEAQQKAEEQKKLEEKLPEQKVQEQKESLAAVTVPHDALIPLIKTFTEQRGQLSSQSHESEISLTQPLPLKIKGEVVSQQNELNQKNYAKTQEPQSFIPETSPYSKPTSADPVVKTPFLSPRMKQVAALLTGSAFLALAYKKYSHSSLEKKKVEIKEKTKKEVPSLEKVSKEVPLT